MDRDRVLTMSDILPNGDQWKESPMPLLHQKSVSQLREYIDVPAMACIGIHGLAQKIRITWNDEPSATDTSQVYDNSNLNLAREWTRLYTEH